MNEGKWWTATWNPITGCSPVSAGCKNCWAANMARRFRGPDGFKVTVHDSRFHDPLCWKKPRKIFVCNMGDLFHEDVAENVINTVMSLMFTAKQHMFFLLTKRPERMAEYMKNVRGEDRIIENLWLGTSVEDQETADERIPILLSIPGFKKFVSVEPMLDEVNLEGNWFGYLTGWKTEAEHHQGCSPEKGCVGECPVPIQIQTEKLDWVILGAETGPGARPMDLAWARTVCDQCKAAGVPFFFKSAGPRMEIPEDLKIREISA